MNRVSLYPESWFPQWYASGRGPMVTVDDSGKPILWHITLDEYQRANLLWLLCDLLGYSKPGVEPFTYANTGDWVGEVSNMLRRDHAVDTEARPNVSADYIRELFDAMKKAAK